MSLKEAFCLTEEQIIILSCFRDSPVVILFYSTEEVDELFKCLSMAKLTIQDK